MVVTRRTPVPPAAASRTQSAQPIPTLAKKAPLNASNAPDKSSPLSNGVTQDAAAKGVGLQEDKLSAMKSKPGKSKGKGKPKKGGKGSKGRTSFTEFLFRLFLLWFTIYTLSVCPSDDHLQRPICRGLAEYRRLVIEPYILPPIQQALAHPSVAPYIQKAQPYADYAVRTAKPVAVRAQKEFNARVVPQWNKRVIPLYLKYAVPQLMKLDARVAPYRMRAEQEYERTVGPYVRQVLTTVHVWQRQAQPYVILAAEKTYEGYKIARPYARPIWEKVQVVLGQLAAFLGEQRRQFVDPHVHKIWEHVKEMSNGKPPVSGTSSLRSAASSHASKASSSVSKASRSISTVSSVASSASIAPGESPKVTISSASSSVAQVTETVQSSVTSTSEDTSSTASVASTASTSLTASSIVSSVSDAAVPSASSLAEAVVPVAEETPSASVVPETVASSAAESATSSSTATPEVASVADQTPSDTVQASGDKAAPVTVMETPAVPETVADVPMPDESINDDSAVLEFEDLFDDSFFAELAEEDEPVTVVTEEPAPEPTKELWEIQRDEEIAMREARERTARRRSDITSRHAKWEERVEERIAINKKALRKSLVAIRKAAVVELQTGIGRSEVESLVADADKFIRGAEKFLASMAKDKGKPEDKQAKWDRVLTKLDDKFSERLQQTESVVNGWYQGVLNQETTETTRLTDEVKSIADDGQADIGLDYAYLDDVTVADWDRYHDLLRKSDEFTKLAQSVQDGSHPSPPINPVHPALEKLQGEVEEVMSGWNTRLRTLQTRGARAFDPTAIPEEGVDDEDLPPVTVGRGKAEVEAALNRVAEAEGQKTSSPDEPEKVRDADAVAQSLGDAVAKESSPAHAEL